MKKIISIGDLHGRNIWKEFADIKNLLNEKNEIKPYYDYYIFLGDYCDAFDKSGQEIYDNLLDILKFKKLYPDNVILLWGNHEMHYILDLPWGVKNHQCSGYRIEMHYDLYELLNKNFDLFQLAFQYDNYLWTHAGIHKGWYKIFEKQFNEKFTELKENYGIKYEFNNLADKLNKSFIHKLPCLFQVDHRRGGTSDVGGPLWLDKTLGFKKPLNGLHQIVGHTVINDIENYKIDENTSITFIDVNHKKKSYWIVNIKDDKEKN